MAQSKSGVLLASEDRGLAGKPAHSVPSWRAASGYWAISADVQLTQWGDQYGSQYSHQVLSKGQFSVCIHARGTLGDVIPVFSNETPDSRF